MVETRSQRTPTSEAKRKTSDESAVKAAPSKTLEIPDEQPEEPKHSGKKKSAKKNAEEVESDEKNGEKIEGDGKNVDKFEAVEMTAADFFFQENIGKNLTADKINGVEFKAEQQDLKALNTEDLKSEKKNAEVLKIEQEKSTAEQSEVATEPKTTMSGRKSAKKPRHPSKFVEKANSGDVSDEKLNKEQKQLDIVEHKHLDNAEGNEKQLGKVEVEQNGLEEKEIVGPKFLVKTGFEEKNVEDVEGDYKQTNVVEAIIQNETPSKRKERKRSPRLEAEQDYIGKVENEVQGLQKEQSGEKRIPRLELINAEIIEGGAEQKITAEMNTGANRKRRWKKTKRERKEAEKMKFDQGISEMDKLEMGRDGAKEKSHIVEGLRENEEKRGKKRKNRHRKKEGGANESSEKGQKVNGEKRAESKGMEGESNAKRKQSTNTNEEMNPDNRKYINKKLEKARKFLRRSTILRREAVQMIIDQGISDLYEVEMGQDGAKGNSHTVVIDQGISEIYKLEMGQERAKGSSHIVESKRENKKNRRKKRKNQNREKEEGENKNSGEVQKVNDEKAAEAKVMEGETNAKNKQTTDANKEMNTDNGKPISNHWKKAHDYFRRCKEKTKLLRDAKKRKIDQGESVIDKLEMGQDGEKENSHMVESKQENGKKRGRKSKNQNGEKEEGENKNSGEVQNVNGEKGAEAKGMEGEANAKKNKTTYTNKEINNFVEMSTGNRKPFSKNLKNSREFFQMCKEKKQLLRDAEKRKIDQGVSVLDKVDMAQEGAKENSHIVESKRENKKKRGKKRKNQNIEKEEGKNKSPGEGQKVNGKKGAESKRIEGETNAKKQQTTYTSKEINKRISK